MEIRLGIIGGGNMAQAIGRGLINKKIINPGNIMVSSRTEKTLEIWKSLGCQTTLDNRAIINACDVIILAVKPGIFDKVINDIPQLQPNVPQRDIVFISVMAGISLETLEKTLGKIRTRNRIIRSMPNTPLMVNEGIIVYSTLNTVRSDIELMHSIFSPLGICEEFPESLINSVSGLAGCGPAYAYLMIEALADGAVKKGVPRDAATKFAAQVFVGAGKMVLQSGHSPGDLRAQVCSPGGTTIAGIHALEIGGVRGSLMNAVDAAVERGNEMTKQTS